MKEHIALEISGFKLVGACAREIWGRPKDVETVEDIGMWVKGMRAGNGGGYVVVSSEVVAEQPDLASI